MYQKNVLYERLKTYSNKYCSDLCEMPDKTDTETANCADIVVSPSVSGRKPKKTKAIVSDPVTMTKLLFDKYRLQMYSYLNKWRRNGKLSRLVGYKVLNRVLDGHIVEFTHVNYWRINRERFIADIGVELTLETAEGSILWEGYLVAYCSFEETFDIAFETLTKTVDRDGYDALSPFLVPIYTNRMIDDRAESLWFRYLPDALRVPEARDPIELARRIGLDVRFYKILNSRGIKGIMFFTEDELVVEREICEYDEYGREHMIPTEESLTVRVPAGTIVINTEKVKKEYSRFHIFHECIHNEYHYMFFRLQQMCNNDPRHMKTKVVYVEKGEEVKDEMFFIENQANRGAYALMLPAASTNEMIFSEAFKIHAGECRHIGETYEKIGMALSDKLHLPYFYIRPRMIQLGHNEARGCLHYVDKEKIPAFCFEPDSWSENRHTYIINKDAVIDVGLACKGFRLLMDTKQYVWAQGHVVKNEEKFVRYEYGQYRLTDYANAHINDCCLRFRKIYKQEHVGRFTYSQMYFDEDYLRQTSFYLEDVRAAAKTEGKILDDYEAKHKFKEVFPMNFAEAIEMLRKKSGISQERLSLLLNMDRKTWLRWVENPSKYRNEDFLTMLCIIFKLPDWISVLLFNRARFMLDEEDKRHSAILHILRVQTENGIDAANEYLIRNRLEPLKIEG